MLRPTQVRGNFSGALRTWLASLVLAVGACASGQGEIVDGPFPVDSALDSSGADSSSMPDAARPDASSIDGPPNDALVSDAQAPDAPAASTHLLLSEVVMTPSVAEYVEIYNPGDAAIDLSNYYLSDRNDYFQLVTGALVVDPTDFVARFPDQASIGPHAYQTVALRPSSDFMTTYGVSPTYSTGTATAPTVAMRAAFAGSLGVQLGLTDTGEPVVLFYWDGASDLVKDVDYLIYGTPGAGANGPVDKTGFSVDGPDSDTTPTPYLADTTGTLQIPIGAHLANGSLHRCDNSEGSEVHSGGNGIGGHNETSEPFLSTWKINTQTAAARTPNAGPPAGFCP
jgi:hypothetical protein